MEGHVSVLLEEALESLAISPTDTVVDATIGGAGHFSAILEKLDSSGTLIGIDADPEAIKRGEEVANAVSVPQKPTIKLVQDNFRNIATILEEQNLPTANKFLFDLGWSSYQLTGGKGLSFQVDEPLLMTYGEPEEGTTAAEFVNTASEEEISKVLHEYGEESFSRRIASAIIEQRSKERILTTTQLVNVILKATPSWYHHKRINPATKTFQALRIYVNDEFGALTDGLTAALAHLAPEGRIAVITFHSSEDRIVKHLFRAAVDEGIGTLYTKKPIVPTREESSRNPRARSAKLRVFVRES